MDNQFAAGVRETDFHVDLIALYEWELANALTEAGEVCIHSVPRAEREKVSHKFCEERKHHKSISG